MPLRHLRIYINVSSIWFHLILMTVSWVTEIGVEYFSDPYFTNDGIMGPEVMWLVQGKQPTAGGSGCLVSKSCPTLCDPMDCSLPGSSVHEVSQARILEWVAISISRGSSWPRESNPNFLHLLHWQGDPLPLHHLRSPYWTSNICCSFFPIMRIKGSTKANKIFALSVEMKLHCSVYICF